MTIECMQSLRPLRISLIEIFLPNISALSALLKTSVYAEIAVDDRQCRTTERVRKVQSVAVFDESLDVLVKSDSVVKFEVFEKTMLKTYLYGACSVNLYSIFHENFELDTVKCLFELLPLRQTIQGRITVIFNNNVLGNPSLLLSGCVEDQNNDEVTSSVDETHSNQLFLTSDVNNDPPSGSNVINNRIADDFVSSEQIEALGRNLPENWVKVDANTGRPYYVNHNTRVTQWERPLSNFENASGFITLLRSCTSSMEAYLTSWCEQFLNRTYHNNMHYLSSLMDNANHFALLGWEKRYDHNGRAYFINHRTRTTQWEDPRTQGYISTSPFSDRWEMRFGANGRTSFVDRNQRMTTTQDTRRCNNVADTKNQQVNANKYDRSFAWKYAQFRFLCMSNASADVLKFGVRRKHLFEDSFNQIMSVKAFELRRRLYIVFQDEEGLDYGGVTREWFFQLSSEILNPMYGLFEYAAINNYALQINSASHANPNHLAYFEFAGRFVAMTFFHEKFMDNGFTLPFYKRMLGKKLTLKDVEAVDPEFYNSLVWIKNNNIDETELDVYFVGSIDILGEVLDRPLVPNGENIKLCEDNKNIYIDLMIEWRLLRGVEKQMEAFLKGFNDVLPIQWLRYFDEREMQLILCGTRKIDVNDWQANTVYKNYTKNSKQIIWFWRLVREITDEQKTRLLQFVTGTCRVPIGGFGQLMGYVGPQKFCIEKAYNHYWLPVSHVCFNRLDLPPYKTYNEMKEKLLLAIEETEGFMQE